MAQPLKDGTYILYQEDIVDEKEILDIFKSLGYMQDSTKGNTRFSIYYHPEHRFWGWCSCHSNRSSYGTRVSWGETIGLVKGQIKVELKLKHSI